MIPTYAAKYHATAGDTTEHVISANPCILYGVYPALVTTGTITIRDDVIADGGASIQVMAIGLLTAGKTFGPRGIIMTAGLTVQLSAATDLSIIAWEPL